MNALPEAAPEAAPDAPTIRYVTFDGDNTPGAACTQGTPCSIGEALSQSVDGDSIHAAGDGNVYANVNLNVTQTITMSGGYEDGNWAAAPNPAVNLTILDGNQANSVIRITGVASPTIEGFIIQNGSATNGAGIRNTAGAAIIRNNIIRGNFGSGIQDEQNATIINNEIYSNTTATNGGGILILNDNQNVTNILFNEIYSNSVTTYGGGIYVSNSMANAFIEGNYIYGNESNYGGGIATFLPSTTTVQSNFVYLNQANTQGGGDSCCRGYQHLEQHNC